MAGNFLGDELYESLLRLSRLKKMMDYFEGKVCVMGSDDPMIPAYEEHLHSMQKLILAEAKNLSDLKESCPQ